MFVVPSFNESAECGNDPYKTLPPIFTEKEIEQFGKSEDGDDFDEVADGSAAMLAYNKLQYSNRVFGGVFELLRWHYKNALLRYCELDTLAMVMLMEGFGKLKERK